MELIPQLEKLKIGIKHAFTPVFACLDSMDFDLEI